MSYSPAAADRIDAVADKAVVVSTEFVVDTLVVVVEVAVAETAVDVDTSVFAAAVVGVVAMDPVAVVAAERNCYHVVATVSVVVALTDVVGESAAVATDYAAGQAVVAVTETGLDSSHSAVAVSDAVDMQMVDTSAVALAVVALAAGTVEIAFVEELETVNVVVASFAVEKIDIVYVVVGGYIVAMVTVAVVDFEFYFRCDFAGLPGYQDHHCCKSCQPVRPLRFPQSCVAHY